MCVIILIFFPRTSINNPFTIYLRVMNMKIQFMFLVVLFISVSIGSEEIVDEPGVWGKSTWYKKVCENENLVLERPQVSVLWGGQVLEGCQGGVWAVRWLAGGHQEPGRGKLSDEIRDESGGLSWLLDWQYLSTAFVLYLLLHSTSLTIKGCVRLSVRKSHHFASPELNI